MSPINSFEDRYSLSEILDINTLKNLFNNEEIEVIPFGIEKLANDNTYLKDFVNRPEANLSHSAMLIKFAPDFIILKKKIPQEVYFIEAKVSITPLYSPNRINEIKQKFSPRTINVSDIGDIAREAWNAYNNVYPRTIILEACSYNPKLFMAQFVEQIECLRCYKAPGEAFDCNLCPVERGEFFEPSRNIYSRGSQTPHTNINFASFVEVDNFFANIGISTNKETIDNVKNKMKAIKIKDPSLKYIHLKNQIVPQLIAEGCDWLKEK